MLFYEKEPRSTKDEVLGGHRGQSQQSRLELRLHLSRRFSPVSVVE